MAQQARTVDAAIVALRKHTHNVLDVELERVRSQHGCTAAAEEVEFALRRYLEDKGYSGIEVHTVPPTIEDCFMQLMKTHHE